MGQSATVCCSFVYETCDCNVCHDSMPTSDAFMLIGHLEMSIIPISDRNTTRGLKRFLYPSFGGSQEPFQPTRRVSVMAPTLLMAIARWWVTEYTFEHILCVDKYLNLGPSRYTMPQFERFSSCIKLKIQTYNTKIGKIMANVAK